MQYIQRCYNSPRRSILLVIFFCILLWGLPARIYSREVFSDYVLILNSYSESTPWSRIYVAPIYDRIINESDSVMIYTEHMNIMIGHLESDLYGFRMEFEKKYKNRPPKTIVFLGSTSFVLLKDLIESFWGDSIPSILCLENDYIETYQTYLKKQPSSVKDRIYLKEIAEQNPNVTIIYTPEYLSETIQLMKICLPEMDRLLFLSDDRYVSRQHQVYIEEIMRSEFPDIKLQQIIAGETQTLDLVDSLQLVDEKTGILFYSWTLLVPRGFNRAGSYGVYRMLSLYTSQPVFCLYDINIEENGFAGGCFYSRESVGESVVDALYAILHNKPTERIIIPKGPNTILNYSVLQKKGLPLSGYPEDALFYRKPESFWEVYQVYIFVSATILFILFLILFFRLQSLRKEKIYQEKQLKIMRGYQRLIDNMPIVYMKNRIIYDSERKPVDYIVLDVNKEFEKIFYSKNVIVGTLGSKIQDFNFSDFLSMSQKVFDANERISYQQSLNIANRIFNTFLISSSNVDSIHVFFVDITELQRAKEKAEEANLLKSAFLANMSHEIRTPLNAIVGFSDLMVATNDEQERQEYAKIIESNNTMLLQLIGDILDLSKIEAGTLDFPYMYVNLNELFSELQQSMSLRISKRVKLIFNSSEEQANYNLPQSRLMQVMTNLLSNAIKFTEEGKIEFGYELDAEKSMLHFYVSDTGCGISKEQQERIFERFVKLDPFIQGTGLGLSICKMIVSYWGGTINIESVIDKGTCFRFTLPVNCNGTMD